jgi:chromatin remodeling complex protein RSC6
MPAKTKSGQAAAAAGTKGTGGGGKRPNALQKPLRPSKELAAVVGADPLPRGEVVSKVWAYIKQHGLQDPQDRREILADAKLEPVFGKKRVGMFEMNKHLARHLT